MPLSREKRRCLLHLRKCVKIANGLDCIGKVPQSIEDAIVVGARRVLAACTDRDLRFLALDLTPGWLRKDILDRAYHDPAQDVCNPTAVVMPPAPEGIQQKKVRSTAAKYETTRASERYISAHRGEIKAIAQKQYAKPGCMDKTFERCFKKVIGPGCYRFRAQPFWQEVLQGQVATPGLEFRIGVGDDRRNFARLPGGSDESTELLPDDDPRLVEAAVCMAAGQDEEQEVATVVRRTASWGKHVKVRRLLASCFAPARACTGAVCEAAKQGHEEVVRELLRAGALPGSAEADSGKSALHFACQNGNESMARLLLDAKAELSVKDAGGRTPCDLARENDLGPMAKRLEALAASTSGS